MTRLLPLTFISNTRALATDARARTTKTILLFLSQTNTNLSPPRDQHNLMRRLIPVRPPPASVRAAATGGATTTTTNTNGVGFGGNGGGRANGGANATATKPTNPPPQPNTVVVDYYGFELHGLSPQQRDDREAAAVRAARRAERWAPFALAGALPTPASTLRRFCRKGVPPELRGWVWFEASGARQRAEFAGPGAFKRLVSMAEERQPGVARQIDLDLPRTFPRNASFASPSGQAALRRILLASAARRPHQGYCQGLNFVAAMLLLAVEGSTGDPATAGSLDACAERAFWLLDALVGDCGSAAGTAAAATAGTAAAAASGILCPGTFAPALEGCHVEMRAFGALLGKKMPKLARHLSAVGCDVSLLATDWFLCLFSTALPSETTARLLDALFADGHPKVLYRAALVLLKRQEKALLRAEHPGEVLRVFKDGAMRAHDRDALLKECWRPRARGGAVGGLPLATILELREAARPGVEAMAAERERRTKGGKGALRDVIEQGRKAQAHAMAVQGGGGGGGVLGGGGGGFSVLGGGGGGAATAAAAAPTASFVSPGAGGAGTGRTPSPQQQPQGGRLTPLLPHQEEQWRQQQLAQGGEEERWGASAWADDSERFGSGRR